MKSVFIDSSVLVAACASTVGASAYLLGLCRQGIIQGYISKDVVGEANKNVFLKLKENQKHRLPIYLQHARLKAVVDPPPELIVICEKNIFSKDAPILAAALQSPCKYLITLDRKHFFTQEVIDFAEKLLIITPGDFIVKLRHDVHT